MGTENWRERHYDLEGGCLTGLTGEFRQKVLNHVGYFYRYDAPTEGPLDWGIVVGVPVGVFGALLIIALSCTYFDKLKLNAVVEDKEQLHPDQTNIATMPEAEASMTRN